MKIPSLEEVFINRYNQVRLGIWMRFCEYSEDSAQIEYETKVIQEIEKYFNGWNPDLSKAVGFDKSKWI